MEREELLHDDIFVVRAEAFAVSVSVGVEDILDELHDGFDVAENLRLGGPERQRGLRSHHNHRGAGELGRRRERRGWGLAGRGRPGEEPTAGRRRGPRREAGGPEEDERGRGAGEGESGGHAAREAEREGWVTWMRVSECGASAARWMDGWRVTGCTLSFIHLAISPLITSEHARESQ